MNLTTTYSIKTWLLTQFWPCLDFLPIWRDGIWWQNHEELKLWIYWSRFKPFCHVVSWTPCLSSSVFSSVSSVTSGKQMIPILNALDVNIAVFGNHDFGKSKRVKFFKSWELRLLMLGNFLSLSHHFCFHKVAQSSGWWNTPWNEPVLQYFLYSSCCTE